MQVWRQHFWNLLARAWDLLVFWMGTTTPGVVVSVGLLLLIFVIYTISNYRRKYTRFSMLALKDAAKESIRPLLVSAIVTGLAWVILLGVFVGRAVYEDHMGLVASNRKLRHANVAVTKEREQ